MDVGRRPFYRTQEIFCSHSPDKKIRSLGGSVHGRGETNSGGSDIVKTMGAGWSGSISSAEAIHNIVIISMGWDALVQPVWCEFSSCSLVPTPLTPCQEAHIYLERMCCVEGAEIWRWLMCKFEETCGAPDFSYNIRVESHPILLSKKTSWQILTQSFWMQTAYVSC